MLLVTSWLVIKVFSVGPSAAAVDESRPKFDDVACQTKRRYSKPGAQRPPQDESVDLYPAEMLTSHTFLLFDSVRHRLYVKIRRSEIERLDPLPSD